MSEVNPVAHGAAQAAAVHSTVKSAPTGSPKKFGATSGGGEPDGATKVSSLADLKVKAPKVYNAMISSIAENIRKEMQQSEAHRKKIQRGG